MKKPNILKIIKKTIRKSYLEYYELEYENHPRIMRAIKRRLKALEKFQKKIKSKALKFCRRNDSDPNKKRNLKILELIIKYNLSLCTWEGFYANMAQYKKDSSRTALISIVILCTMIIILIITKAFNLPLMLLLITSVIVISFVSSVFDANPEWNYPENRMPTPYRHSKQRNRCNFTRPIGFLQEPRFGIMQNNTLLISINYKEKTITTYGNIELNDLIEGLKTIVEIEEMIIDPESKPVIDLITPDKIKTEKESLKLKKVRISTKPSN